MRKERIEKLLGETQFKEMIELNSIEVADMIKRLHKDVLRSIKKFINDINDCSISDEYFIEDIHKTFTNNNGYKEIPCYKISLNGIKYIIDHKRKTKNLQPLIDWYNENNESDNIMILHDRPETRFLDKLDEALKPFGLKGERQYIVLSYRIDYYIKDLNIAIEYDEYTHEFYTYNKEEERQLKIEKELGCRFIRVKDSNNDEYNIGQVIKEMFNIEYEYIEPVLEGELPF